MGYGDYIMLSGVVRDIKKKFRDFAVTASAAERSGYYFEAVFQGNPYLTRADTVAGQKKVFDVPPLQFGSQDAQRIRWSPGFHPIPGNLYFTEEESRTALRSAEAIRAASGCQTLVFLNPYAKPRIVIDGETIEYDHHVNKEWGYRRYCDLVRALRGKLVFVQASGPLDQRALVEGAYEIETPTFRDAAALLSQCDAYLGCEGGLHHAASALDRRGVVIFGGWISPKVTGYAIHDNVYRGDLADACGSLHPCPHCSRIMADISVDEIVLRLSALLDDA